MNLSDFLIRGSFEKPGRLVTDYTADEVAKFQEEYRPLVADYRRHARIAGFGMASFFLCIFLGMILPKTLFFYFWAAGICSWFFIVFAMKRVPKCPACHNSPDVGFGVFCPECGCRTLEPSDSWFSRAPKCRSCGKRMRKGKSRGYKIRACTHCGLRLDDRGF